MKTYSLYLIGATLLLLTACKETRLEKVFTTCPKGCYTGYDILLYNNDSATLRYWSDMPENCESRGHYARQDSLLIIEIQPSEDEFCTYSRIILIETDSILTAQQGFDYDNNIFYRREISTSDYPPNATLIK